MTSPNQYQLSPETATVAERAVLSNSGAPTTIPQSFSRFQTNLSSGEALPIFPLLLPDADGGMGAVLVGDYIAQDFTSHFGASFPGFRDRWLVVSTTQSDTVPVEATSVDLNLFSNLNGVERYRQSAAGNVPHSTDIADGLFVDPEIFKPPENEEPPLFDILYVAKWYPTKNTELLVEVARQRPDIRVGIYGWLLASERKRAQSEAYRDHVTDLAQGLPNVSIYNSEDLTGKESHRNADGSEVTGGMTKEEMRDRLIGRSSIGIYLSKDTEAVNRSCIEMLMCDRPLIVTLPTEGGMEGFMRNGETSLFSERTATDIAATYDRLIAQRDDFTPRMTSLKFAGKARMNGLLRGLVERVADTRGVTLSSESWRDYGGDLWTPHAVHDIIQ